MIFGMSCEWAIMRVGERGQVAGGLWQVTGGRWHIAPFTSVAIHYSPLPNSPFTSVAIHMFEFPSASLGERFPEL